MRIFSSLRPVLWLALVALLAGCSGPAGPGPTAAPRIPYDSGPKWVHKGSGAYEKDGKKAFFGVGVVQGIRNEGLARQTCDNRARGEIAKIFDLYVAAMMKDYQRSTTAGDFKNSSEEQDVLSVQKTITEVNLRGVEIRDHWQNPRSGALYALAVLDLDGMMKNLNQANQLNARVRDYVRDNARKAFNDLDKELGKRTTREGSTAGPAPAEPPANEPEPEPAPADTTEATPAPAPAAKPSRKVRVGLRITGASGSKIQTCFASKLTQSGYALFEGTSDVDVMIKGRLKYRKAGIIGPSVMVNASVELRVNNMDNGQTIVALHEQIKVGRPSLEQSVQTAITRLCEIVVPKMTAKLRGFIPK